MSRIRGLPRSIRSVHGIPIEHNRSLWQILILKRDVEYYYDPPMYNYSLHIKVKCEFIRELYVREKNNLKPKRTNKNSLQNSLTEK